MIKGSIQEEDITIINIYAPNTGAPQYVRQMLTSMKGEINNNTIIVGDFNTPLTPMDRGASELVSYLASKGIVASIGHSNAKYADVEAAIKAGATNVTHTYNAWKPLQKNWVKPSMPTRLWVKP